MRFGISTACYYPLELEKALAEVLDGGAACTELFINSFQEMKPDYLRRLRSMLEGSGTAVASLHPFTCGMEPMFFFGDYDRRFDDGLEIYARYFEMTAELGGSFVVLHGAFEKLDRRQVEPELYVERYARLHEYAKSFGVRIAQENVGRCMSRNPELLRRLRLAIPDVAFVLDVKQTFRGVGDVDDVLDAMGGNIAHLHFSDARPNEDCLPVGEGCFDFTHLLRRLREVNFEGAAVLELYRHNYREDRQLWDSVDKLCRLQEKL